MKTLELVQQAINGDKQAFQQLIREVRPKLVRIAGYYVKNEYDMADIVQEATFKAYMAIHKLKNPNYFLTWITRIVINCAFDFLKKQKQHNPLSQKEEPSVDPAFDIQLYMKEAVAKLTEKQRQVIVLKYFEDLTIQEIAKLLDAPLGTVKTYLHKGLAQLRKELHVVQEKSPKVTEPKLTIEEAIKMVKDELKNRALSILEIPKHFSPVIEDYIKHEKEKGEAFFTWSTEDEEENIEITLNEDGDLLSLTIDMKEMTEEQVEMTLEEKRNRAEAFLTDHYPDALRTLRLFQEKKLENGVTRFNYEQIVFNLPLNLAGCYIDVNNKGIIVNFRYHGIKPVPNIPKELVAKEALVDKLKEQLSFKLQLVYFPEGVYDKYAKKLRLVYEHTPSYLKFRAGDLEPNLLVDIEEEGGKYIPLAPSNKKIIQRRSIEEIVGVTSEMEIIREVDWGSEIGKVWRERDWQEDHEDLSLNGYFERRNEETVKAFINKETGKVAKFMWFKERKGELQLTREECLEKAVDFLQIMIPDYHLYLDLLDREFDKDDEDNSQKEVFTFKVKSQSGYPVFLEIIHIAVNCTTGEIDHYSGLSFDVGLLSKVPSKPSISEEEARRIYFDHLDFQLSWQTDYESNEEKRYLEYEVCAKDSKKKIRYIDALTGELLCSEI
ncbi:sigma-70 family RNA polymerase sigma factor [Bacillus sp. FJAT-49705]|uniref:Sigma-70 family RNA polymerase sigma factor n=1 Tax=Cytobacillus citreus TaxID=2833586 RepID=A0ABS5NSZ2_9BACI|nr:sigma-70 family RNA polymerase sigma factor [Cytobacillus citreus]MBS4190559.1 sigma-70 family RNA polymerase sigma factor [Cytobacillus citreus]